MPKDPMSMFGGLMLSCIRDEYTKQEMGAVLEGALFMTLGICASLVTTYLLSLVGILL